MNLLCSMLNGKSAKEISGKTAKVNMDCNDPSCYNANDDPYPLCKGSENAIHNCDECCVYENMTGPYDHM